MTLGRPVYGHLEVPCFMVSQGESPLFLRATLSGSGLLWPEANPTTCAPTSTLQLLFTTTSSPPHFRSLITHDPCYLPRVQYTRIPSVVGHINIDE